MRTHSGGWSWLQLVAVLLAPGCATEIGMDGTTGTLSDVPLLVDRDLDVLFVVDDSSSMRQEQEGLAAGFTRFAELLRDHEDALPDLHIGVVSTNVGTGPDGGGGTMCDGQGDNGVLEVPDGCPALTDGSRFISDIESSTGDRETNYGGDLVDQFACMAQIGVTGCGYEQPLEAMKRALANDAENAGFLRPAANLAVIVISDEDDCSARDRKIFDPTQDDIDSELGQLSSFRCFEFGAECDPVDGGERSLGERTNCVAEEDSPYLESVSSYADFLRGLKGSPDQVFVATIAGNTSPVTVVEDPTLEERVLDPVCLICPGGAHSGCSNAPYDPDGALVAATPAVRLNAFAGEFGSAGNAQDICHYDAASDALDVGISLTNIGEQLVPRIDSICLDADVLDTDDGQPGVQAQCEVEEGAAAIPACSDGGATPCFRIEENAVQCGTTASHLQLFIERGGAARPADAELSARCVLTPS